MANKYKLIKEYPGSRKIGYISDCCTSVNSEHYLDGNWFDPAFYPEYWEKIVGKDYEILQFICKEKRGVENVGTRLTKQQNGSFWIDPHWTEEAMLRLSHYAIYSIKRLSDGEIFTVGDSCNPLGCNNPGKIDKFEFIQNDKLRIQGKNDNGRCWYLSLSTIEKSKTPLFTTEDGVDYYSDDDLVWDTHNYASNGPAIFSNPEFLCKTEVKWAKSLDRKFFSTKEAAEKYKEDNKSQFSKKDLLYFIHEGRHYHPSIASSDVLKELIRLKK